MHASSGSPPDVEHLSSISVFEMMIIKACFTAVTAQLSKVHASRESFNRLTIIIATTFYCWLAFYVRVRTCVMKVHQLIMQCWVCVTFNINTWVFQVLSSHSTKLGLDT